MVDPIDYSSVTRAIDDIKKSLKSFEDILGRHRKPHFDLIANQNALVSILNDHLNHRVKRIEDSSIDFESYRVQSLKQIEARLVHLQQQYQQQQKQTESASKDLP